MNTYPGRRIERWFQIDGKVQDQIDTEIVFSINNVFFAFLKSLNTSIENNTCMYVKKGNHNASSKVSCNQLQYRKDNKQKNILYMLVRKFNYTHE